jgi:hypothetical protein
MDKYDLRRACAWIGNSRRIAMKHYALLRKSDYLDVCLENKGLTESESGAEQARIEENEREQTAENPGFPYICDPQIAGAGLEPARPLLSTGF